MTTKRYRLTARAQMDGELRDPGYVFTLPEGVKGPHRAVSAQPGANIADRINGDAPVVDEPLYRELSAEEDAAIDEAEARATAEADAHAEACAARDAEQAQVEGAPPADAAPAADAAEPPAGDAAVDAPGNPNSKRAAK